MPDLITMGLVTLFHPGDALDMIKQERRHLPLWRAAVLMLALAVVDYTYIFYVNYVLGTKSAEQANILLELAAAFLPLLSWVVCVFATTSVVVGEATFGELLLGSAYALFPMIVLRPVLGLLSHVFTGQEADVYRGLCLLMFAWTAVLLILTVQRLNDYSFAKTVLVLFISAVALLVLWAVLLLIFALVAQVVYFLGELWRESMMKI